MVVALIRECRDTGCRAIYNASQNRVVSLEKIITVQDFVV